MFKEVVFEVANGIPRSRHTAYFFEHAEISARMQLLHTTPDRTWELIEVMGEPAAIEEFRQFLDGEEDAPVVSREIVSVTPRALQYVVQWARPGPEEPACSIEFLLHDIVGPDAMFNMRVENRRAEVKVAGPNGDKLLLFFNEVKRHLDGRFTVRLLRVGELRPTWEDAAHIRSGIRDEDRQLVSLALAAGYYDNPKRCGVRELGDAVGCSKSVIARRLRNIERRALESLVGRASPAVLPWSDGIATMAAPEPAVAEPAADALTPPEMRAA